MSRKLFIAGNWKMNHSAAKTRETLAALKPLVAGVADIDIAICPSFTSLAAAVETAKGSNIQVGAQNIHWADNGAYTGEVSAEMLKELGVPLVIIGHSERRQFFGETDDTVSKRLAAALKAGLTPIVCVGELLAERTANQTDAVITRQITVGLKGLTDEQMAKTVIAYEPVWAIGTGVVASPAQAQEVHALIRKLLVAAHPEVAQQVRIQYGGSVKADNVKELMGKPDIDGALVGGASLKAADFGALIKNAQGAK